VLAAAAFVAIFSFQVPFPLIIVIAALLGTLGSRRIPVATGAPVTPPVSGPMGIAPPSAGSTIRTAVVWLALWLVPIGLLAVLVGGDSVLVDEAVFFSKAAVVTFGGAYAVLSYVAQQAVEVHQWLAPGEMLDGLGMAETTPGPLIQVVQFVGYMGAFRHPGGMSPATAGVAGSLVTAWVTFVPCFLFVFVGAPFAEQLRGRRGLEAALAAITAAIVGVILNLAVWFSLHTLFADVAGLRFGPLRLLVPIWETVDWGSIALAVGACVAMLRYRVGMLTTLGAAAALGMGYSLLFR
jgi:chromate transporter